VVVTLASSAGRLPLLAPHTEKGKMDLFTVARSMSTPHEGVSRVKRMVG
jgi:hypothetical protein